MKKIVSVLLAALLTFGISLTVAAAEMMTCRIAADPTAAAPGETVTVAIRIADNPGFTNFAIALNFDREHLTLKQIETKNGDVPYLCGTTVSTNAQWSADSGEPAAFVVCAAPEAVKENGILFTASFEIAPDFVGEAQIVPQIRYIRNNEAVFSVFEEIHGEVSVGNITSVLTGDVNGDGIIEYDDVMLAYKAFLGEETLDPGQMAAADSNGNGTVEEDEYQTIYKIYMGG